MEVIQEKRPTCPTAAMIVIILLTAALFGLAAGFVYLLLTGRGSNYLLGTLLAFEFLTAGIGVVLYGRFFIPFREVAEDRDEELLW